MTVVVVATIAGRGKILANNIKRTTDLPSSFLYICSQMKSMMKTRVLAAFVAVAALMTVACNRVSETTTISGNVAEGVETVYITVPGIQFDTVIVAENGKFTATIPTFLNGMSTIECGAEAMQFIADGTSLTVDFENGTIDSNKGSRSIQGRYNDVVERFTAFNEEYNNGASVIYYDDKLSDEEKEAKLDEFSNTKISQLKDYLETVIKKNKANYLGVTAFSQAAMLADNDLEIQSYLDLLDPSMRDLDEVSMFAQALSVRGDTAEGAMFSDFAVKAVTSIDNGVEKVETVSLSDYVGKGKYILVDFWASWCGPCKAEIPNIIAVYEKYAGEKFDVLSIAVWDEPAKTAAAAREEGVVWNQIVNAREIPTDIYGIEGIPHIMLLGPDGTILKRNLRGADIEAEVSKYVQAK